MRLYDREPDESAKAFAAWSVYRDLGPQRSLQSASELYYGHAGNVRQFQRWSKRFGWRDRSKAYDLEREALRREAVQEYLRSEVEDYAAREARIQRGLLEVREVALEQAKAMLKWPLTEQRIVYEDEDGEERTVIAMPAGWTKATIVGLAQLAAGLRTPSYGPENIDADIDLSSVSEEDLQAWLRLDAKINGGLTD